MESNSEGSRKRRRRAVPPEPNKKRNGGPAQRIRNNETAVAHLTKYEGVFQAAGIFGFVTMDRYFSINEAKEVCKGMEQVAMTPACMTVKYKGKLFSIYNKQLESFFDVKESIGGGDVPLTYECTEITRDEATTFLRSDAADICKQWEENKEVEYRRMQDEERRNYVEYFIKWVLLKSGHHSGSIQHISSAKAVLDGTLHPLQVWKRSVVEVLGVGGLPKFPSLISYVLANVFAANCLQEQDLDRGELESRVDDDTDDDVREIQPSELLYYRARGMERVLKEGSSRLINPPSPREASEGEGPPENYQYPPLVAERDAEDLTQYNTFEKRMDFLERAFPESQNPSDWLYEIRTHKHMVSILATEVEEGDKTKKKDIGVLEKRLDEVTASNIRQARRLSRMTEEREEQSRRIQELEGVERKNEELQGDLTNLKAELATKEELLLELAKMQGVMEEKMTDSEQRYQQAQENIRRLQDELKVGKEEADNMEASLTREMEIRDQFSQGLDIQLNMAQKAINEMTRQIGNRELVEVRRERVSVSRKAYEGWEFQARELQTKLEETAKLISELTRENRQLQADAATGSILEKVKIVSTRSWIEFNRLGRMRRDALEIDEAMGLETLRIILITERVNKRNIGPTDWDRVWRHIPLRIRYMIPYFVWSSSIKVVDKEDLYYRLGGQANGRITQILLAELDRDHKKEHYYTSILAIEEVVYQNALPKVAHREHSFEIQKVLYQVVPQIMTEWARRETEQSRDRYTLPRLQLLLYAAGWKEEGRGTGNAFNPYYTSHQEVSDTWMSFVELVPSPALAHLVFPYFYKLGKDPEDIAKVGGLGRIDEFPFDIADIGEGGVWTNNRFWEVYTPTHDVMSWMERCLQNYAIGGYFGPAMDWKLHDTPADFNKVYDNPHGKTTGLYVVQDDTPIYYSKWQHHPQVRVRLAGEEDDAEGTQVIRMHRWVQDIHKRRPATEMLRDPRIFKWYCCVRTIADIVKEHSEARNVVINRDGMMPDGGYQLGRIFSERGPSAVRMYNIIIASQVLKGENLAFRRGTPPGVPMGYLMIHQEDGFRAAMEQAPQPGIEDYQPDEVVAGETPQQRQIRRIGRRNDLRLQAISLQGERQAEVIRLGAERRRTLNQIWEDNGVGEDEVADEEIRRDRLAIRHFEAENAARIEAMIAREEESNVAGPSRRGSERSDPRSNARR